MTDKEKKELEVSSKKEISQEAGEPTHAGVTFVPEVDISESEEGITLFADLPGVAKEDVSIDIREGVLTLTATVAPVEANRNLIYQEYEVGGYQRRFNLGERIAVDKIHAGLANGVLTLDLPRAEAHKPRKIAVQS